MSFSEVTRLNKKARLFLLKTITFSFSVFVAVVLSAFVVLKMNNDQPKAPVIYQVTDEAGGVLGVVSDKVKINGHYTLLIDDYPYKVTSKQYESVNVGDSVFSYLIEKDRQ